MDMDIEEKIATHNWDNDQFGKIKITTFGDCNEMIDRFSHFQNFSFIHSDSELLSFIYILSNFELKLNDDFFERILEQFKEEVGNTKSYKISSLFYKKDIDEIKEFEIFCSKNLDLIKELIKFIQRYENYEKYIRKNLIERRINLVILSSFEEKSTKKNSDFDYCFYIYKKPNKYFRIYPIIENAKKCLNCSSISQFQHSYCQNCFDLIQKRNSTIKDHNSEINSAQKERSGMEYGIKKTKTESPYSEIKCPSCSKSHKVQPYSQFSFIQCDYLSCLKYICIQHESLLEVCLCLCPICTNKLDNKENYYYCQRCEISFCDKCKFGECNCECKGCNIGKFLNCRFCSRNCQICGASPSKIITLSCSHLICLYCLIEIQKKIPDPNNYCVKCKVIK